MKGSRKPMRSEDLQKTERRQAAKTSNSARTLRLLLYLFKARFLSIFAMHLSPILSITTERTAKTTEKRQIKKTHKIPNNIKILLA